MPGELKGELALGTPLTPLGEFIGFGIWTGIISPTHIALKRIPTSISIQDEIRR
jgi:hypothetical protein